MKNKIFWQNSKSWFVYFTETEKRRSGNELKIIHYVQTWPPDFEFKLPAVFGNYYKFGRLKSGVPDISAQDRNLTKIHFWSFLEFSIFISLNWRLKLSIFVTATTEFCKHKFTASNTFNISQFIGSKFCDCKFSCSKLYNSKFSSC